MASVRPLYVHPSYLLPTGSGEDGMQGSSGSTGARGLRSGGAAPRSDLDWERYAGDIELSVGSLSYRGDGMVALGLAGLGVVSLLVGRG